MKAGWQDGDGEASDPAAVVAVGRALVDFESRRFPPPAINASPDGSLCVEWIIGGYDITLFFEGADGVLLLASHEDGLIEEIENDTTALDQAISILALHQSTSPRSVL